MRSLLFFYGIFWVLLCVNKHSARCIGELSITDPNRQDACLKHICLGEERLADVPLGISVSSRSPGLVPIIG